MMALYKYFKKETALLNLNGVLSATIPSSIRLANKLVKPLLEKQDHQSGKTCGQYESFTPEEKAKIAKSAIDFGVTRAIRKLSGTFPNHKLEESSIRIWVKNTMMNSSIRAS